MTIYVDVTESLKVPQDGAAANFIILGIPNEGA